MTMLDNPFWSALTTVHRPVAIAAGNAMRYPREVAPFLAMAEAGSIDPAGCRELIEPGETVYLLGPRPIAPAGAVLEDHGTIAQMICERAIPEVPGPPIVALGEEHRAAVLELTALVYPHYFRARTMELGRYFGIFEGGRLAAMAGERSAMPGLREISAVCTAPGFVGRGLARRLLVWLSNDNLARSEAPFLHVSLANTRARALYEQNGYQLRTEIPFWSIKRRLH